MKNPASKGYIPEKDSLLDLFVFFKCCLAHYRPRTLNATPSKPSIVWRSCKVRWPEKNIIPVNFSKQGGLCS